MLDDIREKKTSLSTYILVGAAGLGMLFLGVPFFVADQGVTVATVNGQDITIQELSRAAQQASPKASQRDVLGSLISSKLIDQHVTKSGFVFPQQTLYEMLKSQFKDNDAYQAYLNQMGFTAKGYEHSLRTELAAQNYIKMLATSQFVVPDVSDQLLANLMAKRNLTIIELPLAPFLAKTTVSDDEAKNYYTQHKNLYKTQPTVSLSYVLFDADQLIDNKTVTEAQIQNYKQKQAKNTLRDGQYLIFDKAEDAKNAATQLKSGKSFAEIAAEIDSKKLSGEHGKINLHAHGEGISKAVDNALFSLAKTGDISPVFDTEYGSMMVMVGQIQNKGGNLTDEQLKDAVAKELAQARYHDLSNQAFDAASEGKTIGDITGILGVKAQKISNITPQSNQPDWLKNNNLQEQLFGNHPVKAGKAGTPIALNDHSSIYFVVDSRVEPSIPSFEQVKARVMQDARQAKAEQSLDKQAQDLMQTWQKSGQIATDTLSALQGSSQSYQDVNLPNAITHVPADVAQAALEQDTRFNSIASQGNRYIVKLDRIQIAKPADLNNESKAQWQQQWQSFQTNNLLSDLNAWLNSQGSISINPQYLK